MKKFFSLLLIISLCFVGNIYGNTASKSLNNPFISSVTGCAWDISQATILDESATTFKCTVAGNSSAMGISSLSKNGGILRNASNNDRTPITVVTGGPVRFTPDSASAMNVTGDDLSSKAAGFNLTSSAVTVGTILVNTADTVTLTPVGTISVTLNTNHDYSDTIDIFAGNYTDSITLSIADDEG